MTSPERNDYCHCGSGKKYKKCCLGKSTFTQAISENQPRLVEKPILIGELKRVPQEISFVKSCDRLPQNKEEIRTTLQEIEGIDRDTVNFILERLFFNPQTFIPQILDQSQYQNLLVQRHFILAREYFFNEIDQYIFYYRCRLIRLLSDRLRAAWNNLNDYVSLATITRQIIEIVYWGVTNNWVLSSCYNSFQNILTEKRDVTSYINWPEIEKFVISINYWPKNNLIDCAKLLDYKIPSNFQFPISEDFSPTIFVQQGILKFIAENWDKPKGIKIDLRDDVATLEQQYKFLSKFVHCTPLLLPLEDENNFPSKANLAKAIKNSFFLTLKSSIRIYHKYVFPMIFLKIGFHGLVRQLMPPAVNEYMKIMNLKGTDIISGIFDRFHGLSIRTSEGHVDIVKGRNMTKKGAEVGLKFDALDEEKQELFLEFLRNMDTDQSNK